MSPSLAQQLGEQQERMRQIMSPSLAQQLGEQQERMRQIMSPSLAQQLGEQQERMRQIMSPSLAQQLGEQQERMRQIMSTVATSVVNQRTSLNLAAALAESGDASSVIASNDELPITLRELLVRVDGLSQSERDELKNLALWVVAAFFGFLAAIRNGDTATSAAAALALAISIRELLSRLVLLLGDSGR